MKKRVIIGLVATLALVGFATWGWMWLHENHSPQSPQDLDTLSFETVRPGLEAASAVSSLKVYIGERFSVWLWVRYDPEAVSLDEASIRNSKIAPFEVRSVSSAILDGNDKETVRLFEMQVQCVTCSPDETYRFVWPVLGYEELISHKAGFVQIRFEISEPYLYNPSDASFRSYDTSEIHFGAFPFRPVMVFWAGIFFAVLGVSTLASFLRVGERVKKTRVYSARDEFRREIARIREDSRGDPAVNPHSLLDKLYFALTKFILREYGADVLMQGVFSSASPSLFSPSFVRAQKAYKKDELTHEELTAILDETEARLSQMGKGVKGRARNS